MRRFFSLFLTLLLSATPALAADPPYLKLAQALGTPHLADSTSAADKSALLLHFVPLGQNGKVWKKMTTVSILKVPQTDTEQATRGVILRLNDALKGRHVKIAAFDQSALPPATCYFEYTADDEKGAGIVYSPDPGFITVAQISVKHDSSIERADIGMLRAIIKPK